MRENLKRYPPDGMEEDRMMGFYDASACDPQVIKPTAEEMDIDHEYYYARHTLCQIPPILLQTAHNYHGAIPLLFALLSSSDEARQKKQMLILRQRYDEMMPLTVSNFFGAVNAMDPVLRLPLAALCFPSLTKHSSEHLVKFSEVIEEFNHIDTHVSLYKYCLGSLLASQIKDVMNPEQAAMKGTLTLQDTAVEASELLAVLADLGDKDEKVAAEAFQAGMKKILPEDNVIFQPQKAWIDLLDKAWPVLDKLDPPSKKILIEGMSATIGSDHQITIGEAELMRTVCGILHCPQPPDFTE